MSKVTKQNSLSKTVHKDRNDKTKSTIKSTSSTIHASSKEAAAVVKRKIAKENGIHSTDEKKSDKKLSTAPIKSNLNGKSDKLDKTDRKHETKVKVESKIANSQNGKSVKKVPSIDRLDKKSVKKMSTVEKRDPKRPKDKLSSSSDKDSLETKVVRVVKTTTESPTKSKTVSKRAAPIKASHAIAKSSVAAVSTVTAAATTAAVAATISTKNVMNQVHNVTVLSPPPVRRDSLPVKIEIEEPKNDVAIEEQRSRETHSSLPRSRTRTRTLDGNEIVLLRPKPTVIESPTSKTISVAKNGSVEPNDNVLVDIKPPISFEVMLNNENKVKPLEKKPELVAEKSLPENRIKTSQTRESLNVDVGLDKSDKESDAYEDDFDSYESDFESDVSNEDDKSENDEDESQEDTSISSGESESDDNVVSTASKHPFETGHSMDNSEFDSGSFELKVLSARSRAQNSHETIAVPRYEQQHDSGIENCSNTIGGNALIVTPNGQMNSLDLNNKTFDNISDIEIEGVNSLDTNNSNTNKSSSGNSTKTKPKPKPKPVKSRLVRRGEELLSKITLDMMNYVLFDFKPIPYELFMKIYGSSNTTQAAVQTHNDRHDQECQSDQIATHTSWTQYPIVFYTEHMKRADFDHYRNGCGSVIDEQQINKHNENMNRTCENSLSLIRSMSSKKNSTNASTDDNESLAKLNIDYGNLNRFLLESEMTLSRILNTHVQKKVYSLKEPTLPVSNGYFILKPTFPTNFANERVHRTFAINSLPGFLFTLHYDNTCQLNVMALWNLSKLSEPVCLLSVWSKVLCVEIHPKIRDIVFAGLDDGSIAVWDYSESKYWHPNLSHEAKRFVPSQITTPTFESKDINDFGRCVAIRALPIAADTELLNGYNPKQMSSLHECGLLILWTVLSNTTGVYTDLVNKRIDHQSLWSKVKLIQNKVIDLRASVRQIPSQLKLSRPTSKSFDKTRSYFESELFSDAALQELHQMNADEEKLLTTFRCTAIELTSEGILISTNENFLLFGRKSFKNESFRRIQVDSNKSVRVECMVTLDGFDDDIVIIALNNGVIKSICCDENSEPIDDLQANSDIEESSSSISSLTPTTGNGKAQPLNLASEAMDFSMASASNGPVQIVTAAPLQATTGFFADGNSTNFGKSCTIQSLVLNERKIYDEMQALNHLENMEFKASAETVSIKTMQKSIRCTQLMNGQTIFNSSIDIFSTLSRQYLVQLVKSKKVITLRKNRIRIYDLLTNQIIEMPPNKSNQNKFIDATTTTADHNEEYLVLLNAEGFVELHQITMEMEPNNC